MKITKEEHYNIFYNGIEYIRFSATSWLGWYGDSLEPEYSDERKLETLFQEQRGRL